MRTDIEGFLVRLRTEPFGVHVFDGTPRCSHDRCHEVPVTLAVFVGDGGDEVACFGACAGHKSELDDLVDVIEGETSFPVH